jgi:hypothetical protein
MFTLCVISILVLFKVPLVYLLLDRKGQKGPFEISFVIGPNRIDFTGGQRQIPVSETSSLIKIRKMDNVQEVYHCNNTSSSQNFRFSSVNVS